MIQHALALFATVTSSFGALAEPLTLDCDILESSHPAFELVDEIVIDLDRQLVDFRQAATMDTGYPRNWIFTNRLEDRLVATADVDGIVAYGLTGGRPLGLRFGSGGTLTFAWIAGAEVWSYRWHCRQ
jgi:hypothetical protein